MDKVVEQSHEFADKYKQVRILEGEASKKAGLGDGSDTLDITKELKQWYQNSISKILNFYDPNLNFFYFPRPKLELFLLSTTQTWSVFKK